MDNQKWLDYSTLAHFMRCPRMHYWRMHRHLTTTGIARDFGKAIHIALATWNRTKDQTLSTTAFKNAMSSVTQEDPKRNLTTGVEGLNAYFARWKDEEYKTIDVEVGFAIDVHSKHGDFVFIGKIDRIVDSPTLGVGIMEHKTTTIGGNSWLNRAEPNMQMDGYITALSTLYGKQPFGGVLDIIHFHEKPAQRHLAMRILKTKWSAQDWARNISAWYDEIVVCDEEDFHPKNTDNCVPIIPGFSCEYTELCSMYPDPYGVEEIQIPGKYVVEPWHPYENREIIGGAKEERNT